METNRAYLAKVGTRCRSLQCLFSQHQAGLLLTPWCHLCWLLFQSRCWQAAEGASGDVVKVLQLWGRLGSCAHISLLYLNVIFACNSFNYLKISSIFLSVHGNGGENNFVFCMSRCFLWLITVLNLGEIWFLFNREQKYQLTPGWRCWCLWEPVVFWLKCVWMWYGFTSVCGERRRWVG